MGETKPSADKVSIRVNFVANYRITDYVRIAAEIDNFEEEYAVVKFFDKDALCSLYELFDYRLDMQ